MRFARYHAIGNDYLVLRPDEIGEPTPNVIRLLCDRHAGVGSDGILIGPLNSRVCDFGLRIFNPDGSEAEKSGNGLRIFARWLRDEGLVADRPFTVETPGGVVTCTVAAVGKLIQVEMGEVRFDSTVIPVTGTPREVLNESLEIGGDTLTFCAATVGNPHCVVLTDDPTPEIATRLGPGIEVDPRFPNRTNVQFMTVIDRENIRIEIWERGAGYTQASGSSSTAAAAVAYRLNLCGPAITVHMPGGCIDIRLRDGFLATMAGPVRKICTGVVAEECLAQFSE